MNQFVTLLINNVAMALDKNNIIAIEPHGSGTMIVLQDSTPGNRIEYFTRSNYDHVVESYYS
jgi:hypothetical protein